MLIDEIEAFEQNNRISVNIYEINNSKNQTIGLFRKSHNFYGFKRVINLLILEMGKIIII